MSPTQRQVSANSRSRQSFGAFSSAADQVGGIFLAVRKKFAKTGDRTRMGRPFERSVKRAGLDPEKLTPHVMRHTAITNLVISGADLPTIQKISEHKTLTMVLRHTHIHGQPLTAPLPQSGERSRKNQRTKRRAQLHQIYTAGSLGVCSSPVWFCRQTQG